MEKETIKLPYSIQIALLSFLIGTLLFLSYFIFPNWNSLLFIGLFYVIVAFIFNTIVIINLVIQFFSVNSNKKSITKQAVIVFANIPIALTYYSIIIYSVLSKSPF